MDGGRAGCDVWRDRRASGGERRGESQISAASVGPVGEFRDWCRPSRISFGHQFDRGGCRPIVFGPGTLWRTWGTRPVPPEFAMTPPLLRSGSVVSHSSQQKAVWGSHAKWEPSTGRNSGQRYPPAYRHGVLSRASQTTADGP